MLLPYHQHWNFKNRRTLVFFNDAGPSEDVQSENFVEIDKEEDHVLLNPELADSPDFQFNMEEDVKSNEAAGKKAKIMPKPVEKAGQSFAGKAWNKISSLIDENIIEPILDTAAEAAYRGVMKPMSTVATALDENIIKPLSEKIDQGFQTDSFFKAQKTIEKGDVTLASEIFQEVKGMSRDQVEEKYGLYRKYSTGKDMAYAVLDDIGVDMKDRERASKGDPTIDNIPIDISPQEVAQLKDLLIPKDTVINRAVAALRGKNIDQLTDAELAGNSILNAFGGVLGGIYDLGEYATMSVKDFFVEGEKKVQKEFDLVELGEKGDLVIRIINEKFTATQKFALYAQFLTEGVIGGGLAKGAVGIAGKIKQIQKIKGIGNMFNKIDTAQSVFAKSATNALRKGIKVAKQATKIGTGRVTGRAEAISEDFDIKNEAIVAREIKDDNEQKA